MELTPTSLAVIGPIGQPNVGLRGGHPRIGTVSAWLSDIPLASHHAVHHGLSSESQSVRLYSAKSWCADCRRAEKQLGLGGEGPCRLNIIEPSGSLDISWATHEVRIPSLLQWPGSSAACRAYLLVVVSHRTCNHPRFRKHWGQQKIGPHGCQRSSARACWPALSSQNPPKLERRPINWCTRSVLRVKSCRSDLSDLGYQTGFSILVMRNRSLSYGRLEEYYKMSSLVCRYECGITALQRRQYRYRHDRIS
jgi:hypothetical protein